jgi:hypothetical protein
VRLIWCERVEAGDQQYQCTLAGAENHERILLHNRGIRHCHR